MAQKTKLIVNKTVFVLLTLPVSLAKLMVNVIRTIVMLIQQNHHHKEEVQQHPLLEERNCLLNTQTLVKLKLLKVILIFVNHARNV